MRNSYPTSIILSLALAATPVSADPIPGRESRVEAFTHTSHSRTAPLVSHINGQLNGICNFARVEIEKVVYSSTAKHCMRYTRLTGADTVLIENFTDLYKRNGLSHVTYSAPSGLPKTVQLSKYHVGNIGNRELTLESCFPDTDTKTMYCYKITGVPYITDGMAVLFISTVDQKRIISKDSTGRRTRIAGMSGGPVFDSDGHLFGTLLLNNNIGDGFQRKYGSSFIAIEPIRGTNGKVIPRLVRK